MNKVWGQHIHHGYYDTESDEERELIDRMLQCEDHILEELKHHRPRREAIRSRLSAIGVDEAHLDQASTAVLSLLRTLEENRARHLEWYRAKIRLLSRLLRLCDFDRLCRSVDLISPVNALDLGCGVGASTRFIVFQGMHKARIALSGPTALQRTRTTPEILDTAITADSITASALQCVVAQILHDMMITMAERSDVVGAPPLMHSMRAHCNDMTDWTGLEPIPTWNAIFAIESFEHIEDRYAMLTQTLMRLRPGGVLCIATWCLEERPITINPVTWIRWGILNLLAAGWQLGKPCTFADYEQMFAELQRNQLLESWSSANWTKQTAFTWIDIFRAGWITLRDEIILSISPRFVRDVALSALMGLLMRIGWLQYGVFIANR